MVYVSTHVGKQHSESEDSVLVGTAILSDTSTVLPFPEEDGFICVADGVGGNAGGAQASNFVLNVLSKWRDNTDEDLKSFLINANNSLIAYASADKTASDMATTLTGICISDGTYKLVHVGNTRAYVRQGKYLKQITSDHTTYNWLLSNNQVEAAERCNRNEITSCFGGANPALLSKLYISDCPQFALALLTSDGVHEYVDLDTLEDILATDGSYSDKCEEIIQRAIAAGSKDDLSVVVICPGAE